MDPADVLVERSGDGVLRLTLNRPEARNAIRRSTWLQIEDALDAAEADESVSCVIIDGAGECFSSGGDQKESSGADGAGVLAPVTRLQTGQRVLRAFDRCRKPTIAAVEGYAIALGWGIALACDFVVASEEAYFRATPAPRVKIADGGLAWQLAQAVGRQRLSSIVMLGEKVGAPEALSLGLVTRTCRPGQALAAARELAGELRAAPLEVLVLLKRLLRQARTLGPDEYLDSELMHVAVKWHALPSL